ncbi:unnamed protein product [Echinostoma caproni]|uniref:Reverse transcriptase domain-containing protein n=1 Tax=Echinostoma caproni TaxID=27848 RepID=A0A183AGT3_9TREM|nr:unnamed protein product [Echinostoma caproni]
MGRGQTKLSLTRDLIVEIAPCSCEDSGIDFLPGDWLSDLEYVDDIVLLSEDPGKLPAFLDSLNASVDMIGMRFAPSMCKMPLQDWVGPAPSLTLTGEVTNKLLKDSSSR